MNLYKVFLKIIYMKYYVNKILLLKVLNKNLIIIINNLKLCKKI